MSINEYKNKVNKWTVTITSQKTGYFEHDIHGEGGSLEFKGKTVVDFDGVYELPKDVIQALRNLGYRFDEFILP